MLHIRVFRVSGPDRLSSYARRNADAEPRRAARPQRVEGTCRTARKPHPVLHRWVVHRTHPELTAAKGGGAASRLGSVVDAAADAPRPLRRWGAGQEGHRRRRQLALPGQDWFVGAAFGRWVERVGAALDSLGPLMQAGPCAMLRRCSILACVMCVAALRCRRQGARNWLRSRKSCELAFALQTARHVEYLSGARS